MATKALSKFDRIKLIDRKQKNVVNGYVRDIEILKTLDIGVQALGTMPVRSKKKNQGELGVDITFGGVTFSRGNYIYADNNGLLLSKEELELI